MSRSEESTRPVWMEGILVDREAETFCLACGQTHDNCHCFHATVQVHPSPVRSLAVVMGDILKKHYLPQIREALSKNMILMDRLDEMEHDEKGMDPAIPGLESPIVVGDRAIAEFRRTRSAREAEPWEVRIACRRR